MSFAIGSLVKARGREWVVLPGSEEALVVLRPMGGTEAEVTGIYLPLETVEPRPYQLVPLLMALKLDPVRLLIADDVGIGKTIEACLVARELLDRGEIQRIAVLCQLACDPKNSEVWYWYTNEFVLESFTRKDLEESLSASQGDAAPRTIQSAIDALLAALRWTPLGRG